MSAEAPPPRHLSGARPGQLALVVGVGILIWILPRPAAVDPRAWRLLAIFVATVVGIIAKPLPMGAMAIVGMAIAVATRTLTTAEALSGFSNATVWLVVDLLLYRCWLHQDRPGSKGRLHPGGELRREHAGPQLQPGGLGPGPGSPDSQQHRTRRWRHLPDSAVTDRGCARRGSSPPQTDERLSDARRLQRDRHYERDVRDLDGGQSSGGAVGARPGDRDLVEPVGARGGRARGGQPCRHASGDLPVVPAWRRDEPDAHAAAKAAAAGRGRRSRETKS